MWFTLSPAFAGLGLVVCSDLGLTPQALFWRLLSQAGVTAVRTKPVYGRKNVHLAPLYRSFESIFVLSFLQTFRPSGTLSWIKLRRQSRRTLFYESPEY